MHGAGDPPVTGCRDGLDTDRTPLSATQGRAEQTQRLARYHLLAIALGLPEHRVLDVVTYNAIHGAPRWQDRRNIRRREAVARARAILQDTRTRSLRFSTRKPVNRSRMGPAAAHEMISLTRSASDRRHRFVTTEAAGSSAGYLDARADTRQAHGPADGWDIGLRPTGR
jgi:hypothetical protein